jgi:hypothetical protein
VNLGEARALVRSYINEPLAATWTDARLNSIIQEANREIWHKFSTACSNWLAGAAVFQYPANTVRLALPAIVPLGGGVIGITQKVLGLFTLANFAQPGSSNVPVPMRAFPKIADLYLAGSSAQGVTYSGAVSYDYPGQWYNYTLMGTDLYVWPIPAQVINILIFGIPTVATPTFDTDNLFVGRVITDPTRLTDHHELVALLAAVKAKAMVGDPDNGLTDIFKHRLQSSLQVLALDQQMQDPQQVRGIR